MINIFEQDFEAMLRQYENSILYYQKSLLSRLFSLMVSQKGFKNHLTAEKKIKPHSALASFVPKEPVNALIQEIPTCHRATKSVRHNY